jgi:hypothetical protein
MVHRDRAPPVRLEARRRGRAKRECRTGGARSRLAPSLTSVARKSSNAKPYIGDQILAILQGLTSCCFLGFLSSIAAVSFGIAWKPSMVSQLRKDYPSEAWKFIQQPKYAIPVGLVLAAIAILTICWIVATWRGRRWAIWLHLITNAPGAVLGLVFGARAEAVLPILISVYCLLRLSGNLGANAASPPSSKRKSNALTGKTKAKKRRR